MFVIQNQRKSILNRNRLDRNSGIAVVGPTQGITC